MKTAFIFAGQGAQYIGMGCDFFQTPYAEEIFKVINVDFDFLEICKSGPASMLNDTQYTQVCIFAISMLCARMLEANGIHADTCAGLSLGEYSALCYARAFDVSAGAHMLEKRGKIMANATPEGTSMMSAVLMLDEAKILTACEEVRGLGICEIANYNCPGQIVITGEKKAVEECGKRCLAAGAKRVIPLAVSGAFHSSLLKSAEKEMYQVLQTFELKDPCIPVYHNLDGLCNAASLIETLSKQISHAVRLQQIIENMVKDGVDTFVEVGPGKAISGFVRKCCKDLPIQVYHVEDSQSLHACVHALKGE